MEADLIIAEHYESIIDRVNANGVSSLSVNDRTIWYVATARCEKDMEGFESIFVQCFGEQEVPLLIAALRSIDEPELGDLFARAYDSLRLAGYYIPDTSSYYKLDAKLRAILAEVEWLIGDRLWDLDGKLARLVERN